jgi:hypothetical protein
MQPANAVFPFLAAIYGFAVVFKVLCGNWPGAIVSQSQFNRQFSKAPWVWRPVCITSKPMEHTPPHE